MNTSSVAGIIPPPFKALYSLTKYGVTGMTKCLKYEFAEKGIHFSTIFPANIATTIFNKSIDGKTYGDLRIPDDAYPVEKAASVILEVAEQKGIIVVPENPNTNLRRGEVEEQLFQMARDRRAPFEKGGGRISEIRLTSFFAAA